MFKRHDDNEHSRRLLEQYAREAPGCADLLDKALKRDANFTRTGLLEARSRIRQNGGIARGAYLMALGGSTVKYFVYIAGSEGDDTIRVQPFDGNNATGDVITIEKEPATQRSAYDGTSYTDPATGITWTYAYVDKNTRTATSNETPSTIQTQRITPSYENLTANIIYAVRDVEGWNSTIEGENYNNGNPLDYIDLSGQRRFEEVVAVTAPSQWTIVKGFTAIPLGNYAITISNTSALVAGMPLRYTTVAGGVSHYYYAVITVVASNSVTIAGISLSGQTITKIWSAPTSNVVQLEIPFPGQFAVGSGIYLMAYINKSAAIWLFGPSQLVNFKAFANNSGAGTAIVNALVAGGYSDSVGVIPGNGTWVSSAHMTESPITYGDPIDVSSDSADSTAMSLTVAMTFVLA